jgi:uncharacterized protein (DUF58 family)
VNAPLNGVSVALVELIALRGEARLLDITPRNKVLATRSGGHLSRFRGRGMEFDESRVYQPGDDVRNMDWRITARAGKPHVKLFREERERPVWLLVDQGPSMRFGTRVAFKSVIAAKAAALLAWAAADRGDRVGGLVFDEACHVEHRPAARTRGLLPLLQALVQRPALGNRGGHPGLTEAAEQLQHLVRPGSLVFLLSDFVGISRERTGWLAQLGAACELVLVHLYDPLEIDAPPPGLYPVSHGARRGILNTAGTAQRTAWQQRFSDRMNLLEDLTRRHRAHLLSLRTDLALGDALARGLRPRSAGAAR